VDIQGVVESCTDILTTSYWLYVELGKNIKKILCQKINVILQFLHFYILKIHPVYHILLNVHQCGFLVLKHISYRLLRIGVHFIKHDIQGVFLKCAEILPTRLWDNV
jgi:hypothetical protein